MASLRTTSGGSFVVCFRFGGRHFQRGLKTKDPAAAEAARCRVIDRLYQLSIGSVTIPAGVDTGDFIVWGRTSMPESGNGAPKIEAGTILSVNAAIQRYLEEQRGLKADSTLGTERTHLNYLTVFLGARPTKARRRRFSGSCGHPLTKRCFTWCVPKYSNVNRAVRMSVPCTFHAQGEQQQIPNQSAQPSRTQTRTRSLCWAPPTNPHQSFSATRWWPLRQWDTETTCSLAKALTRRFSRSCGRLMRRRCFHRSVPKGARPQSLAAVGRHHQLP
jgi:hypothetical protein